MPAQKSLAGLITTKSGNATHDANIATAEATRQATMAAAALVAPSALALVQKAADAQCYMTVVQSAITNGISPVTIAAHLQALAALGLTRDKLPPGFGTPGYVSKGWP